MNLTRKIVNGLNFAGGRTRVAVVTYADEPTVRFNLNRYSDKVSVLNAIAFTQEKGRTNTARAIRKTAADVFTGAKGDRVGDDNVMIVITDGKSNIQENQIIPESDEARGKDIKMIAIGIGKDEDLDRQELIDIANKPDSLYAYVVNEESDVEIVSNKVLDQLCQ